MKESEREKDRQQERENKRRKGGGKEGGYIVVWVKHIPLHKCIHES